MLVDRLKRAAYYLALAILVAAIAAAVSLYRDHQQQHCRDRGGHPVELQRDWVCVDPDGRVIRGH